MEIIGEACNHISTDTKQRFSEIEWSQIVGIRNVLVHEYFGVDSLLVWQIIKNDLPALKSKIEKVLEDLKRPIALRLNIQNIVTLTKQNTKPNHDTKNYTA